MILTYLNHIRARTSATLILMFWPLYTISLVAWGRTTYTIHQGWDTLFMSLECSVTLLGLVSLALECLGPYDVIPAESGKAQVENPLLTANTFSKWVRPFSWNAAILTYRVPVLCLVNPTHGEGGYEVYHGGWSTFLETKWWIAVPRSSSTGRTEKIVSSQSLLVKTALTACLQHFVEGLVCRLWWTVCGSALAENRAGLFSLLATATPSLVACLHLTIPGCSFKSVYTWTSKFIWRLFNRVHHVHLGDCSDRCSQSGTWIDWFSRQ